MKDKLGRSLFRPFGVCGRCYVIPTPEREVEINRFQKWFVRLSVLVSAVVIARYGTLYGCAVCVVACAVLLVIYRRWQSDMAVCEPDLVRTFAEGHLTDARGSGKIRLWSYLALCFLLLACGVLLFVREDLLGGLMTLMLSGIGIVVFGWRLLLVHKTHK